MSVKEINKMTKENWWFERMRGNRIGNKTIGCADDIGINEET